MPHTLTRRERVVAIFTALLVIAPFALIMQNASAGETQVYRWVDKNGTVSFGNQPPPSVSSKTVTVHTTEPTSSPSPNTSKNSAKTSKKHKKKAAKHKKRYKLQMTAAGKSMLCMRSRKDLAALQNHGRFRKKNADGSLSYLSQQQIQRRIAMDNQNISKYCN